MLPLCPCRRGFQSRQDKVRVRITAHFDPRLPGYSSCLHPTGLLLATWPAALAGAAPQLPSAAEAGPGSTAPTRGKPLLSSHKTCLIKPSVPLPSSCSGQDRQPRQNLAKQLGAAILQHPGSASSLRAATDPRLLLQVPREPTSPGSCLEAQHLQIAGACGQSGFALSEGLTLQPCPARVAHPCPTGWLPYWGSW